MFNELTLALQVVLLVLLYIFVFATVRVIAKDVSVTRQAASLEPVGPREKASVKVPPRLVVRSPGYPEQSYPINDQLIIGRGPDCDINLDDGFVSMHHARVYSASSSYWLEDLHSTNGTMYKGKPVEGPVKLSNGSEFAIGENSFQFTGS